MQSTHKDVTLPGMGRLAGHADKGEHHAKTVDERLWGDMRPGSRPRQWVHGGAGAADSK